MSTALTVYSTNVNAATLTTARKFAIALGSSTTNAFTSLLGTATGYGELCSQGTTGAWAAGGSLPAGPSGNGFFLDDTSLEGQQILAGDWTPIFRGKVSVGTVVADIYVRAWMYNGSTYTQIGTSMVLTGQTFTTTSTTMPFAGTSQPVQNFTTGQKLYVECLPNVTSNSTGSSLATIGIVESTVAAQGTASCFQVATPGYQPIPVVATSPTSLSFSAIAGGANPASQNSTLSETAGAGSAWTSSISYGSGSGWLSISTPSGTLAAFGTQTQTFTCTTGALAAGIYTATVTHTATASGATATVTATFAVSAASTRSNPYGVTVGLRLGNNYIDPGVVADAAALGLGWIRIQTLWDHIETSPGVYSTAVLDVLDDAIHRCNVAGLHVQFPIQTPPSWHRVSTSCDPTASGPYYMDDPAGLATFADFLSKRWNGVTNVPGYGPITVDSFEIGNENFDGHFNSGAPVTVAGQTCRTPNWLAPCLIAAAPKIRANSPNALVGMAGLWWEYSPHRTSYMQGLYDAGCKDYFDYANFHFYPSPLSPGVNKNATCLSLNGQINEMYNVMVANGDGATNIWVTEFGWPLTDISDATRQTYMNQAFEIARTNTHVGVMNLFSMSYTTQATNAGLYAYSLVHAGPTYTGTYTSVQNYITAHPPSSWPSGGGGSPPAPTISSSAATLSYTGVAGGANPANQTITLTNAGTAATAPYTAASNQSWLTVSPASNTIAILGTDTSTVSVSIAGLSPGTYTGTITYTGPKNFVVVTITLTVTASGGTVTPLTVYLSAQHASVTTDNTLYTVAGTPATVIATSQLGAATGWGEITAQGTTSAWAATAGSATPAPTNFGFLLDSPLLEGSFLPAGLYTAAVRLHTAGSGSATITANIHCVLSKRLADGTKSVIADTVLTAQSIVAGTAITFSPVFTTTGITSFSTGDKLQVNIFVKVTANPGTAVQTLVIGTLSSDTTGFTGSTTAQVVTPGFTPSASTPTLTTFYATRNFSAPQGSNPAAQSNTLSETAGAGSAWTSSIAYGSGSGWLAISPTSGTLTANGSQAITLTCTTGALALGTYTATVTYTATTGGSTATVSVTFVVTTNVVALLAASPGSLTFAPLAGGASPASQNGVLSETAGVSTTWTSSIPNDAGWLTLTPSSGALSGLGSQSVVFSCTTTNLVAGTYVATVIFTAATGAQATLTVTMIVPCSISIAGIQVVFAEDTFALSTRMDERQRCQFTVLDYAGTQHFSYRQNVVVADPVLGILFSGFVADAKQDKTKTYPDTTIEHLIDCFDNRGLVDKVTSKWIYANQYAGTIAVHQAQKYLAAEGVTVAAALRWDEQLTDWQAGTLVGTVATSNAFDANPGDGDLELALAGTVVTKTESTTANWNAGTRVGVVGVSNQLVLTSHNAAKFTSFCNGYSGGNNFIYESFYTQDYTIANGDTLIFSMWISSSSPAITASVNGWCSDGSHTYNLLDSNLLSNNPNTDLTGYANDQWYTRSVDLSSLAGKTLENLNFCFAGNSKGVYTAYYHDVLIQNGGTTKLSAFTGSLQDNGTFPYHFGYDTTQTSITTCTAYDAAGTRISPVTSLTPVGVLKSGYVSWTATTPNTSTAIFSTSLDGGATWQVQAQNSALVGVLAGADATAKTLLTQIALAINGPDPTQSPAVSLMTTTINPSYAATKSDVTYTKSLTADFTAGTFTNTASANNHLTLAGAWRNWTNNDVSGMTIFGAGTPHIDTAANQVRLTATAGGDCRTRMDFAGTYNKLDMSVDFAIPVNPGTSDNCGLEWGTTNWGNSLNSYAYNAFVNLTGITFARGTNSAGAGGFHSIQTSTFPVPLNQGDWHTLRVVWDGSIHSTSLYIDGSLTFTNLDATYTAAGNVAMRYFNSSGGLYAGNFDNFSVVKTYTNTKWVSPNYSLNAVGTCGNSQLTWQDVLPASSVLLVESTINGGGVWSACTNGGVIPGLTNGVSCTGVNLQVRVTFTEAVGQETMFQGFTAWVMSRYSSTGTRVSPSLSLDPVGRAGTALVNWNATLPTNTSLVVKTSRDAGVTYQTVGSAGAAIPTITVQPAPVDDSFVTNTSANYTNTHGAGGTTATITYDTATSRITATGGTSALYLFTASTSSDVDLFVDMDTSDFGGLAWRFVDANNYYDMAVRDASSPGSAAPNSVQCFKVVAGVRTLIGPNNTPISFARGTYRRIRVTMLGSTITAYLDGTQLLSFTDTSISTAGQCGLRNDTFGGASTARFYRLRLQPQGDDVTAKSLLTKVTLTSTDPTVTPQLLDMQAFVSSPAIGAGTLIPSASYLRTYVDANYDDLAKQSNYGWYVDQFFALNFQGRTAQPAPWILSSNTIMQPSDIEADSNLLVESAGTVYRNRQILTNVIGSATYTDTFVGDGKLTSFNLRYPVAPGTIPTVTLNNNKQTIGLQGTSGSNWYYAVGSVTIAQDTSGTVLVGTDTLSVPYTGTFTTEVVANNTAAQTALAAVEGGSGIVEAVEDVSAKNMTVAAATTYANQLLIRNCIVDASNLPTGRTLTYKTYHNGLVVGQSQTVFFPEEHLNDIELYITQIDVQMQTQPGFTTLYNYVVTCTELPKIDSWPKLLASGLVD